MNGEIAPATQQLDRECGCFFIPSTMTVRIAA